MELRTQRVVRLLLGGAVLAIVAWGLYWILDVLNRGPDASRFRVYVLFKNVQALQTGRRVVYRGMTIGGVAALELDPQSERVRALVTLDPEARSLVRTTSQFWIVRPRFSGITSGPTGLDTLIKESYLRLRAPPGGEPLEDGQELLGLERPPDDLAQEDLDEPMIGDLLATAKLPNSHGLRTGSPVTFRGRACGEVRRVSLSTDGRGVLVRFRVRRAFRHLARESSRFWVARPVFEGSLFTGITVNSLGSLLEAALAFDTRAAGSSQPLTDDAVVVGLESPPSDSEPWKGDEVDATATAKKANGRGVALDKLSPWVEVRYVAIEQDTWSADDDLQARGEGVLFRNAKNELCAITARSVCDGAFLLTGNIFDRVRVTDERIRVALADGRVWPAHRVWVAPEDLDLAVLRLQTPVQAQPAPLPDWTTYLDFDREPGTDPDPQRPPSFLLRHEGRVNGLVGRAKADAKRRVLVSLASVPAGMRPKAP